MRAQNILIESASALFADGAKLYQILNTNKKIFKIFKKLLKKFILNKNTYVWPDFINPKNIPSISLSYFEKNAGMADVIQIIHAIYAYNFEGTRGGLSTVGKLLPAELQDSYILLYLRNWDGLTAAFSLRQSIRSSSSPDKYQKAEKATLKEIDPEAIEEHE